MKDILLENNTHPIPFPLEQYRSIIVLAAHPDDEVYGCGGLIAAAVELNIQVKAIIVTNGEASDLSQSDLVERRREESRKASDLLGYDVEFLGLRDRSLRYDSGLVDLIANILLENNPDLVLAPTINDYHPDHQALALAALAAFPAIAASADLAFYETVGPLDYATHYVDLTTLYARKRLAMEVFASQESVLPYAQSIEARDRYRAMPHSPRVTYAECYRLINGKAAKWCDELLATFNLRRACNEAWVLPADAPLISVLIRTVGDPFIFNAIASVLAQTYRPIEIIVVAARRLPHETVRRISALPEVRFISADRDLSRSEAANLALKSARGRWVSFLDDDDYWKPLHLERLAKQLAVCEDLAVCTGAVVEDLSGNVLREYTEPPVADLMLATNQIPIHTVLFDRRLIEQDQICFDENLEILEDWDFWLQLQCYTKIRYVPGKTSVYRWTDRSGLFVDRGRLGEVRRRIHDKWFHKLGWEPFERAIERLLHELETLREKYEGAFKFEVSHLRQQLAQEREKLTSLLSSYESLNRAHDALLEQYHGLAAKLQDVEERLQQVLNSKSWRFTRPLRAASKIARRLIVK